MILLFIFLVLLLLNTELNLREKASVGIFYVVSFMSSAVLFYLDFHFIKKVNSKKDI